MNVLGPQNLLAGKYLAAPLAFLLFAYLALGDDKPKAPAKAVAKSAPAAGPAGGAGTSKSSTPATAHGPTTSPSPTTTTPSHQGITTRPPTSHVSASPGNGRATHTQASTTPKTQRSFQSANGISGTRRADGKVATLRDPKRGMEVHHTLSGNRRVEVERADHSRIVVERGGQGYVQGRPYAYRGHEYARRSYYYHGRYYHGYYGRCAYHGVWLNPYYPTYYYSPAYYTWAYYPWAAPVPYLWGWNVNPWYGFYGAYFTPYPVYANASLWLTDYIIANSLAAAYEAQVAVSNPAPLTPEVKQLIAGEVREQVALENIEAQAVGKSAGPDPAISSIQQLLNDGKAHVFVAGHDLDVVDAGGSECGISEGDALQINGRIAPDAAAANLSVLASKGGKECPKGDVVSVALADLQDMQNHMRETIDAGLQELRTKQGQGGLPAVPTAAKAAPVESPMAAIAPPPPPESDVAAEINQQLQQADKAEKEAGADAVSGPVPSAAASGPRAGIGSLHD